MDEEPQENKCPAYRWVKRFGVAGFLFFLIKGLIWLGLFFGATYFGLNAFE